MKVKFHGTTLVGHNVPLIAYPSICFSVTGEPGLSPINTAFPEVCMAGRQCRDVVALQGYTTPKMPWTTRNAPPFQKCAALPKNVPPFRAVSSEVIKFKWEHCLALTASFLKSCLFKSRPRQCLVLWFRFLKCAVNRKLLFIIFRKYGFVKDLIKV